MNAFSQAFPVEVKNEFTVPLKKHGYLRTVKYHNVPIKKHHVSKGCHNCSYHLSRYYYWKQSPCDNCSQSPMFYCRITRMDLPNQWKATTHSSDLRKNVLQS